MRTGIRADAEAWAQRTGRAVLLAGSSPECPLDEVTDSASSARSDMPRVTYPFEGSRFVIDPERPAELQQLEIHVEPDGASTEVRVDGALLPKTRAWQLAPGAHTITAQSGTVSAPAVHFVVR